MVYKHVNHLYLLQLHYLVYTPTVFTHGYLNIVSTYSLYDMATTISQSQVFYWQYWTIYPVHQLSPYNDHWYSV